MGNFDSELHLLVRLPSIFQAIYQTAAVAEADDDSQAISRFKIHGGLLSYSDTSELFPLQPADSNERRRESAREIASVRALSRAPPWRNYGNLKLRSRVIAPTLERFFSPIPKE